MAALDVMGAEATLIAVADAASVRLFVRRRPGTPLEELVSTEPATNAIAETPADADFRNDEQIHWGTSAHAFLLTAASRIVQAARQSRASRLVLCAPPHALCAIRDGLDRSTRRLLTCELTGNVAHEPLAWLHQHKV